MDLGVMIEINNRCQMLLFFHPPMRTQNVLHSLVMSTKLATNHSKTTASVVTNTCVAHLASEAETVTDNCLSNTPIISQVETLTNSNLSVITV